MAVSGVEYMCALRRFLELAIGLDLMHLHFCVCCLGVSMRMLMNLCVCVDREGLYRVICSHVYVCVCARVCMFKSAFVDVFV